MHQYWAHQLHADFVVDETSYHIINEEDVQVADGNQELTGALTIPSSVVNPNNGKTYNVVGIGRDAYSCSFYVTSVVIPDTVTTIGNYAFIYCGNLSSVNVGDGVTSIGEGAFYNCKKLTDINIGDSVATIGNGAFYICQGLTSIVFPESLTSFGHSMFYYCSNLTSITFLSDDFTYDSSTAVSDMFYMCNKANITVYGTPNSSAKSFADDFGLAFAEYEAPAVQTSGDFSYEVNDDEAKITAYSGSDTAVVIPSEIDDNPVTVIGNKAFKNNTSITSLTIPETVTRIAAGAFNGCSNLTIYGYGGSAAETYASDNNIPFELMVKINTGSGYAYAPLGGTQSKTTGDTSFNLSQSDYNNFELLGVQKKTENNTTDMRFVAVINEGIIKSVGAGDIVDYGFVLAKAPYTSTAQATEGYISKITLDDPKTAKLSCVNTDNKYCGTYGIRSANTKYKYITMTVKKVLENQGFAVRFYIQTTSGKVYYANYNTEYTGCVTSYAGLSTAVA